MIRATGGRLRQLPQAATDVYLQRITEAMRLLSPLAESVPVVLLGPSPYASSAYPSQRPHAPAVAAARRWARSRGVAFVDLDPLVGPSLAAGTGNPDGMHWGWQAHRLVGDAVAAALSGADGAGDPSRDRTGQ